MAAKDLSKIPSVDKLLHTAEAAELIAEFGRPMSLEAIRRILDDVRANLRGEQGTVPTPAQIVRQANGYLSEVLRPTLRPLVNATGVILHTNLGRAPLSDAAIQAIQGVAQSYSTLEYDLELGQRGSRYLHTEDLLIRLTGAEAALVVNNNASALLLVLSALARRRRVLIARTQLVEIGGGFRIPDILQQSGAILEEIGATNKVNLQDYSQAINAQPIQLVMRAHRSNFKLEGFVGEPSVEEIAAVAHGADIQMVDDLGSGTLLDTARFGMAHEMTVQESLAAGADLVTFSGDKLLGGPQAGIIVGRKELVAKLRKHPIARAVRADKLALAGLSATLMHYIKDEAEREIPIWQMISTTPKMLKERATSWQEQLGEGTVVSSESAIGGGSLPGETLQTYVLALAVNNPDEVLARLRRQSPAIIARVENDRILLDPRTVRPKQESALMMGVQQALGLRKL